MSGLQFAFFSPSPRSSYSNGGQVVALWAVMDANEALTVDFHSKDIQHAAAPAPADGCLPYFSANVFLRF